MSGLHYDRVYLGELLREAVQASRDHRLRTFMSVVAMAIGIASVLIIGLIAASGRDHVFAELESYGLATLWVYRDTQTDNPLAAQRVGSGIDNGDYAALKQGCCDLVKRFSAQVYADDWQVNLRVGSRFTQAVSEGVDVEYLRINRESLSAGRNFRPQEVERRLPVAVIGAVTRDKLFGPNRNVIGKTLRMGELRLTIIGVMQAKRRDLLQAVGAAESYDINNRILIPYTLYQQRLGSEDIHTLLAEASGDAVTEQALAQIKTFLQRRHRDQYQYIGESMRGWVETANEVIAGVTFFGLAASLIALFTGCIGIMGIMSASVVERTREIGIRLAVGARRRDIRFQFLLEGCYLVSQGGVVGLLLGLGLAALVAWWTGIALRFPLWLILLAVAVTMLCGVLAAYLPAKRASNLSPVEALRHD